MRKKYSSLVEKVKRCGSSVLIFSDLHVSGERKTSVLLCYVITCIFCACALLMAELHRLGGIAAILRYSVPELDTLEADKTALDG